jgi:mercuric ion binding protein
MKILPVYLAVLLTVSVNSGFAQKQLLKDSVAVSGNCSMCKRTIERAAKSAGASAANWNTETRVLALTFAPAKTSTAKIQQAVAGSGYDTRDYKGNDKAYQALHECCKYDRKNGDPSL